MRRVYLDYAASTPVRNEVKRIILPYFSEHFGNPGSLHSFGQEAMSAVDTAREKIAKAINADFREVIFTSGATEANNLALRGLFAELRGLHADSRGNDFRTYSHTVREIQRPKLIVSAIEHESILDTAYSLEREGVEVVVLPVDKKGVVDLKKLEAVLDERTVLISVMYVNNEIGSVQPIAKIAEVIRNFRNSKFQAPDSKKIQNHNNQNTVGIWDLEPGAYIGAGYPLLHIDAAQAFEYFDCDVTKLGVDLMTLSSQKVYGPKGAGALYIRNIKSQIPNPKKVSIINDQNSKHGKNWNLGFSAWNLPSVKPMVTGGGQEFGLRSGTENVPAITGFGEAVRLAEKERAKNTKQVTETRSYFLRELKKIYPRAVINGNRESGIKNREMMHTAPHILNVYFPTEFAGDLLTKMDIAGIAASSGSACSARSYVPSHVLEALRLPSERVRGSVRFSFGTPTTKEEIGEAMKRMRKILEQ